MHIRIKYFRSWFSSILDLWVIHCNLVGGHLQILDTILRVTSLRFNTNKTYTTDSSLIMVVAMMDRHIIRIPSSIDLRIQSSLQTVPSHQHLAYTATRDRPRIDGSNQTVGGGGGGEKRGFFKKKFQKIF